MTARMTTLQPPTISIALCTYNGVAHLREQWQSLLEQQLLPDEIIISDDQSTDGTPDLLIELAKEAPFRVHIINNAVRLGYNKNFEQALSTCTSDLIFICDQDDFWLPKKISLMTDYMIQHQEAQLAFCDAWVTNDELAGRQSRVWEAVGFESRVQERWKSGEMMEIMLDGNRMMGCATVVRRSFLPALLPIPDDLPGDYIYDGWMALVGAACNAVHFVNQPLQLYRTHVQQQVGIRPEVQGERIKLQERIARHRNLKLAPLVKKHDQLIQIKELLCGRISMDSPGFRQLNRRLAHYKMRSNLPHSRLQRIAPVLNGLRKGNYNQYADAAANWFAPYLAVLGDILE